MKWVAYLKRFRHVLGRFTACRSVVVFCAFFACAPVHAELLLAPWVENESLSPHLQILRDPEGRLTPEQARAAFRAGRGETSHRAWPQFGFTPDTVWVRFQLRSALEISRTWLVELRTARMDELDWTVYRGDGRSQTLMAGT